MTTEFWWYFHGALTTAIVIWAFQFPGIVEIILAIFVVMLDVSRFLVAYSRRLNQE